jgi:hypothetical protein
VNLSLRSSYSVTSYLLVVCFHIDRTPQRLSINSSSVSQDTPSADLVHFPWRSVLQDT